MFAPVTRVELETALNAAIEPIREALAKVRADIARMREHGATKADLQEVRAELTNMREHGATKADLQEVRAELTNMREHGATKADLQEVRAELTSMREHGATKADVEAMGRRIVMWVGSLLTLFIAVVSWLLGRI